MKCAICGKEISKSLYSNKPLCSDECFGVDFWRETLDEDAIIINQNCYHVGKEGMRGPYRGFGGAKHKIILLDTGEIIETNNLWSNGRVPDEFYKGDNAKFA